LLLDSCTSVFCVLELQRGDALYVSPNVARVFNAQPEALLGCVRFLRRWVSCPFFRAAAEPGGARCAAADRPRRAPGTTRWMACTRWSART
jgi:hypothetical protein